MFKTISAALLAVSVLAAPAFAATGKNDEARIIKATPVKASVLNANARMGGHHHKHYRHVSHRHHKHIGAIKTATGRIRMATNALRTCSRKARQTSATTMLSSINFSRSVAMERSMSWLRS